MRKFGIALILLSFVFVVIATINEADGSVTVYSRHGFRKTYTKKDSPKNFRNLMTYSWIKAPLPAVAGFIILCFIRRQDRLDPSSPHFQGSQALDELGEYFDRELEKRQKAEQDSMRK